MYLKWLTKLLSGYSITVFMIIFFFGSIHSVRASNWIFPSPCGAEIVKGVKGKYEVSSGTVG